MPLLNNASRERNAQKEIESEEQEMVLVLLAQLESSQIRNKTNVLKSLETLSVVKRRNAPTKLFYKVQLRI